MSDFIDKAVPLIRPVILSGGSGTRLWPLSRPSWPKQMLRLTEDRSMLQLAALRVAEAPGFAAPIVIAGSDHASSIECQLAEVGCVADTLILEPSSRGTAAAIALAAHHAATDELLLVMPSDHAIRDVAAFHAAVAEAASAAREGWLVTFGVNPDRPETSFGYIQLDEQLGPATWRVRRFVEKPDRATAENFLANGDYSWNGGMFLFSAGAFLRELRRHALPIAEATRKAIAGASHDGARLLPEQQAFAACPHDSIDYAVLEKADRVAVVPVDMGWSDVGSWDALHALSPADDQGTVAHGDVIALDTRNCLLRSDGPLVAAIGIQDLIVVATGDAVLVLPKDRSQDIKWIVEELKARSHPSLER